MKAKLDEIIKRNDDMDKKQIEKAKKDSDAMIEELKNAKADKKKNYWAMALQLKCKNMMAEKMKKLDADKTQFEKSMMEATDDHANNVEALS